LNFPVRSRTGKQNLVTQNLSGTVKRAVLVPLLTNTFPSVSVSRCLMQMSCPVVFLAGDEQFPADSAVNTIPSEQVNPIVSWSFCH